MKGRPDPLLQRRGALARLLPRFREMLPGSLVFRRRRCGKANCICARGRAHWHRSAQLVIAQRGGAAKTYHVPHHQVQEVQRRLALRAELEAKVREILRLNLERWLAEKKPKP